MLVLVKKYLSLYYDVSLPFVFNNMLEIYVSLVFIMAFVLGTGFSLEHDKDLVLHIAAGIILAPLLLLVILFGMLLTFPVFAPIYLAFVLGFLSRKLCR